MKHHRLLSVLLTATLTLFAQAQNTEPKVAYLFTYFTGNAPEQEQICYALSDDGYNYTPLNYGAPVIKSDTIALTGCVRDPHILRGEDGNTFYMVVTDMKSSLIGRLMRFASSVVKNTLPFKMQTSFSSLPA